MDWDDFTYWFHFLFWGLMTIAITRNRESFENIGIWIIAILISMGMFSLHINLRQLRSEKEVITNGRNKKRR